MISQLRESPPSISKQALKDGLAIYRDWDRQRRSVEELSFRVQRLISTSSQKTLSLVALGEQQDLAVNMYRDLSQTLVSLKDNLEQGCPDKSLPGYFICSDSIDAVSSDLQHWRKSAQMVKDKADAIILQLSSSVPPISQQKLNDGLDVCLEWDEQRRSLCALQCCIQSFIHTSSQKTLSLDVLKEQEGLAASMYRDLNQTLGSLKKDLEPFCPDDELLPGYAMISSWALPFVKWAVSWFFAPGDSPLVRAMRKRESEISGANFYV